eukprot:comp9287_c0_seq1/m.10668 comp9287_c0_seq1/g.10668  ORF comp9287_c0_seq1/g.10668 comp9287_c0_seq1/m.10668 type:complete len:126 (+) comp9287_c0_seq1:17-394(+)
MSKEISREEVSQHSSNSDCWVVINGKVYNVTKFLSEHPGGEEVIVELAGQDCTQEFEDVGHSANAREMLAKYEIGTAIGEKPAKKSKSASSSSSSSKDSGSALGKLLFPAILIAAAVFWKFFYAK